MGWTPFQLHQYELKRKPKEKIESPGAVELESLLHTQIEAELKARRYYYVHSRMDKRTTTQLGVTDFIVAVPGGKTLWLEAKRKGGKLTQEQNITRHILVASGHWHEVVYSFTEFMKLCPRS